LPDELFAWRLFLNGGIVSLSHGLDLIHAAMLRHSVRLPHEANIHAALSRPCGVAGIED
jgi:hypothetical protein